METHTDYLRRVVPPGRLFFYSIKDGWEPLCQILGKPVPDIPFPRFHDGKDFDFFRRQLWWDMALFAAGIGAVVAAATLTIAILVSL
jgi:hypothetical protein